MVFWIRFDLEMKIVPSSNRDMLTVYITQIEVGNAVYIGVYLLRVFLLVTCCSKKRMLFIDKAIISFNDMFIIYRGQSCGFCILVMAVHNIRKITLRLLL